MKNGSENEVHPQQCVCWGLPGLGFKGGNWARFTIEEYEYDYYYECEFKCKHEYDYEYESNSALPLNLPHQISFSYPGSPRKVPGYQ